MEEKLPPFFFFFFQFLISPAKIAPPPMHKRKVRPRDELIGEKEEKKGGG